MLIAIDIQGTCKTIQMINKNLWFESWEDVCHTHLVHYAKGVNGYWSRWFQSYTSWHNNLCRTCMLFLIRNFIIFKFLQNENISLFFISGANLLENQENTEKVGITWYHYIESFLRWLPYVPFGIILNAFKRHCVLQDVIYKLLFLRHIYNLDANSSTQIVRFLTRCLPIAFTF